MAQRDSTTNNETLHPYLKQETSMENFESPCNFNSAIQNEQLETETFPNSFSMEFTRNICDETPVAAPKRKPYTCIICNRSFADKVSCEFHMETHDNDNEGRKEKRHECDECGKRFARALALQMHALIHKGEKPFECGNCTKRFTTKLSLKVHMRGHTNERPYKCDICGKAFKQRVHMKEHRYSHTDEGKVQCKYCKKSFPSRIRLKYHVLKFHQDGKPYKCAICNVAYQTNDELNLHKTDTGHDKVVTPEQPAYRCEFCEMAFETKRRLNVHIRATHKMATSSLQQKTCKICNREFNSEAHLTRHMRVHTGEQPYSCPVCDKKFSVSSNIPRHLMMHTGEKPHECDQCDAKFVSIGNLKRHQLLHTGVKAFTCDTCSKSFYTKFELKYHLITHEEQKPFSCKLCGKQFALNKLYVSHMKAHTLRQFPCDFCDRVFVIARDLNNHLNSAHREEATRNNRIFTCGSCERTFFNGSAFKYHKRKCAAFVLDGLKCEPNEETVVDVRTHGSLRVKEEPADGSSCDGTEDVDPFSNIKQEVD